jgi:hypothetical protein
MPQSRNLHGGQQWKLLNLDTHGSLKYFRMTDTRWTCDPDRVVRHRSGPGPFNMQTIDD